MKKMMIVLFIFYTSVLERKKINKSFHILSSNIFTYIILFLSHYRYFITLINVIFIEIFKDNFHRLQIKTRRRRT